MNSWRIGVVYLCE